MKAKDGTNLIRDPEDWARDWGWISNRRAKNMAAKLLDVAQGIRGALDDDEGAVYWASEIEKVAKQLGKDAPAAIRNRRDAAAEARV